MVFHLKKKKKKKASGWNGICVYQAWSLSSLRDGGRGPRSLRVPGSSQVRPALWHRGQVEAGWWTWAAGPRMRSVSHGGGLPARPTPSAGGVCGGRAAEIQEGREHECDLPSVLTTSPEISAYVYTVAFSLGYCLCVAFCGGGVSF